MTTLYDNGKLFTADPARPWASAMAVENGDIVWGLGLSGKRDGGED